MCYCLAYLYGMDNALELDWKELARRFEDQFGQPVEMKGILFLIGVQELGIGAKKFSKQEKMDLIHIAICKLLSKWGYYDLEGKDKDEWPIWNATNKLPFLKPGEQTRLLKQAVVEYFKENGF